MLNLIFIACCSFVAGLITFIYLAQTGINKITVKRRIGVETHRHASLQRFVLYDYFEPLLTNWFSRERYLNLVPLAIATATFYFLFKLLE